MTIGLSTYLIYLALSIALTIWVGRTLHKNGRVFLVDVFHGNDALADSVNHLLCLKSQKSLLDRVSTGSGSDLVSDQQAIFLMIPEFYDLTRSLPLPVLTRSRHHPDF